jgi:hypothetical protein
MVMGEKGCGLFVATLLACSDDALRRSLSNEDQ